MRAFRLAAVFLLGASSLFAQYRTAVWIPGWDLTNVLNSLQLNAGKLTESNPVWYQINSDGTIAKSTSVAEDPTWRAAMTGTQVLPTIQNTVNGSFNATVAENVISSANRDAHAENIRQLVVNQAYDGIDIDYESLPLSARSDFTAFITTLASKLHASGKKLSVTLYAKTSDAETWDGAGGEDYAAIGQQADWVKLMCYDYSWSTSPPGPMAPLSWIDQVVTYAQSVIASPKIIVGLPWYGYDWGSTGVGITYQQAMSTAAANNAIISYDPNGEATYTYSNHTVYFQDANSYNKKADLITQKHPAVGGFAAWRIAAEDPNIWTRVAALKGGTTVPASPAPPSSPTSLAASAASANAINLTWVDLSSNEDGFRIERCAGAGCTAFAQIAQLAANTIAFADSGLTSSSSYTYRVIAYNSGGTSAYSNNATATTQAAAPATNSTTLISAGSVWKYLDNGSNQGTAWSSTSFDDSTWKSGPAQLGYGDGDEATVVGYGPDANNKYVTTYFRQAFNVADATQYTALKLRLVRDDGAVVYLNGKEVTRPNMPTGTILYNTLSAIGVVGTDESTFFEYAVDPTLLITGRNVLAVEIHQFDPTSSDISFDAELTGTLATAPPPPPAAPTALAATADSQVTLTWTDNATNEDGYRVERCIGIACTAFAQIAQIAANATTYVDASVAASTSYSYRVVAYNGGGTSAYSNVASATTIAPPPVAAPSNLLASAVSASQVNLSWTDNATNEDGYRVERCSGIACSAFAQIAQLAANATTYADASLAASTSYSYRVVAYNSGSTSAYSNIASATTLAPPPLAAPSNLSATAVSASQVSLSWTDNTTTESGFYIERCAGAGCTSFAQIAQVGANVTSYSDPSLAASVSYSYRVRAFDATSTSAYSNVSTATTQAATLSAPTNLIATATSAHSIQLTWTDNSTAESGFRIERCIGSKCGGFSLVTTVGANTTSFTDSGLDRSTYYKYRVSAVNGSVSSSYSNTSGAQTFKN